MQTLPLDKALMWPKESKDLLLTNIEEDIDRVTC